MWVGRMSFDPCINLPAPAGKVKASVRCLRLEVESLGESAEGKAQAWWSIEIQSRPLTSYVIKGDTSPRNGLINGVNDIGKWVTGHWGYDP